MNQAIIGVLEQQRRDALVAWYLGQLAPLDDRFKRIFNENDLYEYLLIDNQVMAQVDTSRVAQGIASVQQQIHAIYNGMEPGYEDISEDTLSFWRDGMSRYSLWAGYQMLEDYPENYLLPSLRLNKTEMFKTFEAELSQARLTHDTVQAALGNYLQAFETVSNLTISACYVDSPNFLDADYYFIGRQEIEPFAFYWRKARAYMGTASTYPKMAGWTQWKPVESVTGAQIRHCRPVVMDGRLYVVWAEPGQAVLNEQGGKTGQFEYRIRLVFRRLDDSWSVPVLLHTGQAPDELLANAVDGSGVISKGYRLSVSTDHGDGGRSRLLLNFMSLGFPDPPGNIDLTLVWDELLNPMGEVSPITALLSMAGTDSRRVQFAVDQLHNSMDMQWTIASVVRTTEGQTAGTLNGHLELSAEWRSGELWLQGRCNKAVNVRSGTEFRFTLNGDYHLSQYRVSVYADRGSLKYSVEKIDYYQSPIEQGFRLVHLGTSLAVMQQSDFEGGVGGYPYKSWWAVKSIDLNPDELLCEGINGGFALQLGTGVHMPLIDPANYYRTRYVPAPMEWAIWHRNVGSKGEGSAVLNGAARSPVVRDDWTDPATLSRTYQWGEKGAVKGYGINAFIITREPVTVDAAPHIWTDPASGAQWLDIRPVAPSSPVRLNTLFASELTRKASLSLQSALSWETQHTVEPSLPGQTEPAYVDFNGANGQYFWELFFHAAHLIAARLRQEFDYAGAQQWLELLFNPQVRVAPLFPPPSQVDWMPYWTCRPLGLADGPALELEGLTDPDAIARGAPSHYRKAIFMLYLNNLIDWGDMLYRQLTRDTLNEAKLLYVRALSLLGPLSKGRSISRWEPVTLDEASASAAEGFAALESTLSEGLSSLIPVREGERPWLRLLDQSSFRLPVNTQLLDLWDRLDVRLNNLRHNLTLDGKPMHLALYEAPVNPLDLLRAQLNGSGLGARRLGSQAIIPPYRFRALLPRAQSAVETLTRFAQQVLNHMESRDRTQQEELQQGHVLDDLASFAGQLQQYAIDEAEKALSGLKGNRLAVEDRQGYYEDRVLEDVSALEKSAQEQRLAAMGCITAARALGAVGHLANLAPNLFGTATGGMAWGGAAFAPADLLEGAATVLSELAQQQLNSDMQTRRREEWKHQARQAELELDELDRQIEAQSKVIEAAITSLSQTTRAREQAKALYAFIKDKPANAGLYQWLLSQMSTLYFQAYDAVLSMCLAAEACWQYEIGDRDTRFISATAWVDNRFGLMAGETLKLGLLQMESAFLSRHERRLEITKTLSLKALLRDYESADGRIAAGWEGVLDTLRNKGQIDFQLKSSTFDKDYPGHYLRQLVRVSVSLPVVLKPYQDIHATLSQQTSSYLLKPQIGNVKFLYQQAGDLPEGGDDDIRQDQIVFNPRSNQQVGLSTGVDDSGMFMLDFGDERYFPFEGTGAISRWTLSFPNHESEEQQAMFDTLNDVILHIRYLAVDGGKAFAADVEKLVGAVEAGEAGAQVKSLT